MNIAEINIQSLQKNTFGGNVIEFIIGKSNNEDIPYKVTSNYGINNDWNRIKDRFDFNKNTNFIVLGIGNGTIVEGIYANMSNLSTLTVIEKYNSVLMKTLGTKDMSRFLHDNRVCIIAAKTMEQSNALLKLRLMDERFVFNTPNISIVTSPYLKSYDENFVNETIYYISSQITYNTTSFGNDINDVLEGFDHIVDNWDNILSGLGINDFKDVYKGVPAIIVSAGPSLDKNIELLKKAYGKALILTVDATAKKVMNLGIIPDTISTIERPDSMYSIFYENMSIPHDSVFLGPPVVTKKILDSFSKKIITGRKGETIVKTMVDLFDYESIEIGMSCSHIPFGFAKYIGADPIVFIGQDLSFSSDGRTHFNDVENYVAKNADRKTQKWVVGNNGEKLLTNSGYYSFLLWFENEIANTTGITFINATEGGARIKGTINMKLSDVIDKYCTKEIVHLSEIYDKNEKIQNLDLNMIVEKGNKFFDELIESASFVQKCIEEQKEEFIELKDKKTNFNKFYDIIDRLYKELSKNNVLRFIIQPFFVSYYRSVHQYSIKINDNEWNKLIFEAESYYEKLFNVMEVLKDKFNNYKDIIKGDID